MMNTNNNMMKRNTEKETKDFYVPSLEMRLDVAGLVQRTLNGFWEAKVIKYITTCERNLKRPDFEFINSFITTYLNIEKEILYLAISNKLNIEFDGYVKKGFAAGLPRRFKVTVAELGERTNIELIYYKLQNYYKKPLIFLKDRGAVNIKSIKESFTEDQIFVGNNYEVLLDDNKVVTMYLAHINYRDNGFNYVFKTDDGQTIYMDAEELRLRVRKLLYLK